MSNEYSRFAYDVFKERLPEPCAAWAARNTLDGPVGKPAPNGTIDPIDLLIGPPTLVGGARKPRGEGFGSQDPLGDRAYFEARGVIISAEPENVLMALRAYGRPLVVNAGRATYEGERFMRYVWNKRECAACGASLGAEGIAPYGSTYGLRPIQRVEVEGVELASNGMCNCRDCQTQLVNVWERDVDRGHHAPSQCIKEKKGELAARLKGLRAEELHAGIHLDTNWQGWSAGVPDKFVRMALPDGSGVKIMHWTFVVAARACGLLPETYLSKCFPRMKWAACPEV